VAHGRARRRPPADGRRAAPALLAVAFDEEFARLRGLPVTLLYLLLLCLVALTVVLLIRVVGLILVIALLTLPPPSRAARGHARPHHAARRRPRQPVHDRRPRLSYGPTCQRGQR